MHVLDERRLKMLNDRNPFPFAERVLAINNVRRINAVRKRADRAVAAGFFSKYVIVEDHAAEALEFFALTRESLGSGYYYSIAELVGVYLSRTEYMVHYAGDCIPLQPFDWITPALQLMARDPRIKVCNLTWDEKYTEAKSECCEENDNFHLGYGFSDQCYLIRAADFRFPIYSESHPDSARYPGYGGELFEKRVDSWMRNHRHLRATFKHASYVHRNWPLTRWERAKKLCGRAARKASGAFVLLKGNQ